MAGARRMVDDAPRGVVQVLADRGRKGLSSPCSSQSSRSSFCGPGSSSSGMRRPRRSSSSSSPSSGASAGPRSCTSSPTGSSRSSPGRGENRVLPFVFVGPAFAILTFYLLVPAILTDLQQLPRRDRGATSSAWTTTSTRSPTRTCSRRSGTTSCGWSWGRCSRPAWASPSPCWPIDRSWIGSSRPSSSCRWPSRSSGPPSSGASSSPTSPKASRRSGS